MLNLAIRGHDISGVTSIEELAKQTNRYGIKNLQLALNQSFPKWSGRALNPGLATHIRATLREKEITVALLSCYSNVIHPDAAKREKILQHFERYLFYAHYFDASMVASETGSVLPEMGYSPQNFTDEVFEDLVIVIKRLVAKGSQYRTMVGIEGGLNHPLYSNDRIEQLVQAVSSEYLGIIYDPTNLIDATTYIHILSFVEDAFKRFGDQIVCVHLKDFRVEDDKIIPVPLGQGELPYRKILQVIEHYKPYCYIVLEETKDTDIPKAIKQINETI